MPEEGVGWRGQHLEGDVRIWLRGLSELEPWHLMIAHPDCTYLTNAGVWAFTKTPPNPSPLVLYGHLRLRAMHAACAFFRTLQDAPIRRIAIENPIPHGLAVAEIGIYQQTIQPYQFGDDASKRTCLWLKGLPLLRPLPESQWAVPRIVNGKKRWSNQTDSGQNKLPPSATRSIERARTYPGIAKAMAEQWGKL